MCCLSGGVPQLDHPGGTQLVHLGGYPGQLPWWPLLWWPLRGGYPSWSIQRGGPLPWPLPGGPLPWPLLGGPMWPSHHALDLTSLLSRHQLHSGKVTWEPPPPRVGQIVRQTRVNALPSHTTYAGGNNMVWTKPLLLLNLQPSDSIPCHLKPKPTGVTDWIARSLAAIACPPLLTWWMSEMQVCCVHMWCAKREATRYHPGGKMLSMTYLHDEYSAHRHQLKVQRSCRMLLVERTAVLTGCSWNV